MEGYYLKLSRREIDSTSSTILNFQEQLKNSEEEYNLNTIWNNQKEMEKFIALVNQNLSLDSAMKKSSI